MYDPIEAMKLERWCKRMKRRLRRFSQSLSSIDDRLGKPARRYANIIVECVDSCEKSLREAMESEDSALLESATQYQKFIAQNMDTMDYIREDVEHMDSKTLALHIKEYVERCNRFDKFMEQHE